MFLLTQHAGQCTRFHHRINVIGSNIVFTHHRNFKQAENSVRHAVKEPDQRAQHKQAETHWVDNAQGDRLGRNHADTFRRQVSEENKEAGDHGERANKAELFSQFMIGDADEQGIERR